MKLSIITINRNNVAGLRKTLESVAQQVVRRDEASTRLTLPFEHIIIDGASTDESVEIIKAYANKVNQYAEGKTYPVRWISEPDKGIYNAMNKGIRMAEGEYCQFLNSGDMLAADDVTDKMLKALDSSDNPDVFYGDMQKVTPDGKKLRMAREGNGAVTLNMFYRGCLNHSPAYIKKSLFDEYGMYDETLRICSDWKFYMQSLILGKAKAVHANILVTIFDTGGISETQTDLLNEERNRLLNEMIPQGILRDYDRYHFAMSQYDRLKKHHLWGVVWFMERVLFKLEKWGILR